jgi:DNA-binding PadR family transcriptional regulator
VNYGAIYPLLRRLEARGEIVTLTTNQAEAGASRKTYSITDRGKERWHQKMLEHPHESWVNRRSRFAIKYFFFNQLEPQERFKLLEHRLRECHLRLEKFGDEFQPFTDSYQEKLLQHCSSVLRLEIQWLSEQLANEQNERQEGVEGLGIGTGEFSTDVNSDQSECSSTNPQPLAPRFSESDQRVKKTQQFPTRINLCKQKIKRIQ